MVRYPMDEARLILPFAARGHDGSIEVSLTPNHDPSAIGCPPWAEGFPVCTATIDYPGSGYTALLGWVQLVSMRSPRLHPAEQWVTDPLAVYADLETPFGFYGIAPTLFDAPARSDRTQDLAWQAETFLCCSPGAPMAREVGTVAAFSWGFVLEADRLTLQPPTALALSAWNGHIPRLEAAYPSWTFIPAGSPAPPPPRE